MKYSIWIVPPEPVYTRLQHVIDRLGEQYQGEVLTPHLSVVTDIEHSLDKVAQACTLIAAKQSSFSLHSGPISFSTTRFQNVLVRVNSSAPLMQLNIDLRQMFGMPPVFYMPHISLLYGNHDVKLREKIAREIQLDDFLFTARELSIVASAPDPGEWKPVATIPFDIL